MDHGSDPRAQIARPCRPRAVLVQDLAEPGLPFRYAARVEVALDAAGGATLAASVANAAEAPFPFGLGWHPFFVRPPLRGGTRLAFRATTRFGHDARTLPVAPRRTRGIDGGARSWLGLDDHFAGWDGRAAIELADGGPTLRLLARGAWAGNLQVFAPRHAAAVLCVEPQSHVPDAPNRPACAAYGPLRVLAPGESLDAALAISVG